MRVVVDRDVCQDHAQCVFAAPQIFSQDDTGRLLFVADPDDALRDAAEEAADVCPVQAITIEG